MAKGGKSDLPEFIHELVRSKGPAQADARLFRDGMVPAARPAILAALSIDTKGAFVANAAKVRTLCGRILAIGADKAIAEFKAAQDGGAPSGVAARPVVAPQAEMPTPATTPGPRESAVPKAAVPVAPAKPATARTAEAPRAPHHEESRRVVPATPADVRPAAAAAAASQVAGRTAAAGPRPSARSRGGEVHATHGRRSAE